MNIRVSFRVASAALLSLLVSGSVHGSDSEPEEIEVRPSSIHATPLRVDLSGGYGGVVEFTIVMRGGTSQAHGDTIGVLQVGKMKNFQSNCQVARVRPAHDVTFKCVLSGAAAKQGWFIVSLRDSVGNSIKNYWIDLGSFAGRE